MAKNWKFGEAVRAIQSGNKEDIMDIGRRFPLFSNLAAQVNEAGMALIDCVPDYCTARKIESVLKGDVQETTEEEAVEEEVPEKETKKAPVKKEAPKKAAPKGKKVEEAEEDDEDELEGKSAKELFEMCKEAGLKVKPKQDKAVYIEALKAADNEEDEDEDWEEEEETPKKAPAKKAAAKKAPKKASEDDDEDWDI